MTKYSTWFDFYLVNYKAWKVEDFVKLLWPSWKKLEIYKSRNLSLTPTASPTSRPLRQPCYSPDEFHRGIQAMQSWFRNLDDSQRTLALQSITVRTTFLTSRFLYFNLPRFSLNYDITTVHTVSLQDFRSFISYSKLNCIWQVLAMHTYLQFFFVKSQHSFNRRCLLTTFFGHHESNIFLSFFNCDLWRQNAWKCI